MSKTRRFVILRHDHPQLHWDLMLDTGNALRTWRLEREPQGGVEITAVALGDHRRMYLDYEGPVGGDRGTVARWDAGTYSELEKTPDSVVAAAHGKRLNGTISLWRTDGRECWVFVYRSEGAKR